MIIRRKSESSRIVSQSMCPPAFRMVAHEVGLGDDGSFFVSKYDVAAVVSWVEVQHEGTKQEVSSIDTDFLVLSNDQGWSELEPVSQLLETTNTDVTVLSADASQEDVTACIETMKQKLMAKQSAKSKQK